MAQLVAHHTGSVGVRGSSPLSSTRKSRSTQVNQGRMPPASLVFLAGEYQGNPCIDPPVTDLGSRAGLRRQLAVGCVRLGIGHVGFSPWCTGWGGGVRVGGGRGHRVNSDGVGRHHWFCRCECVGFGWGGHDVSAPSLGSGCGSVHIAPSGRHRGEEHSSGCSLEVWAILTALEGGGCDRWLCRSAYCGGGPG